MQVLVLEIGLHDTGGLNTRAQDVLLGRHVIDAHQPIQAIQVTGAK